MVNTISKNIIGRIIGDKSRNKKEAIGNCEFCGKPAYRMHSVHLTDYGVRKLYHKPMCEDCIEAEEEGNL
jgi:hypothetical protein